MNGERVLSVLHLPWRTPYVQKLRPENVHILNVDSTPVIPRDVNCRWLLENIAILDACDVIHFHFFELEPLHDLTAILTQCVAKRVAVVVTVHDVIPMFGVAKSAYLERIKMLCRAATHVITLTPACARLLNETCSVTEQEISICPHGFVIDPSDELVGTYSDGQPPVFACIGTLRPNRDFGELLRRWCSVLAGTSACLRLLVRRDNLSAPDVNSLANIVAEMSLIAKDQITFVVADSYLPDSTILEHVRSCSALLMPYRWGSHSGQLELAFDAGLVPIIPNHGFYFDQWNATRGTVPEPLWFSWSPKAAQSLESQLLNCTKERVMSIRTQRDVFRAHRLREHKEILEQHRSIYQACIHL